MDSLKDMDITSEEVEKFENALKDEKFRKMFVEYAEEISNPENRKLYEEEITKMEAARGTDVQFIFPVPGFVLKTSVNGDKKAFINVCKNGRIEKASSTTTFRTNAQGKKSKGDQWSMPHSLSNGRDDRDKSGAVCRVYDVVFHPDTFTFAEKDPRLKQLMIDTSINGIETNFQVKFDKANIKEMKKLKFKGTPVATMLRTQSGNKPTTIEDGVAALNLKYPYDDDVKNRSNKPITDPQNNDRSASKTTSKPIFTVPEYSIIHRGEFDMQNFTNSPDSMMSTRPKELVIKIKLPLLDSAANVDLEVHERQLVVECVKPVSYKLDVTLPYPVIDDRGTAKFDKSKRCLVVTLPVIMQELPAMPSFAPAAASAEPLIQEVPDPVEDKSNCDVDRLKDMEETRDIHENGEIDADNDVEGEKVEEPMVVNCKEEEKDNEEEISLVHPTFTFSQDNDFVHLVIDACGVQPASVVYQLPALQDAIGLKMMDVANPGGPIQYSLYLKFTDGCTISKDVSVDVSAENVVVALEKQPSCKGLWEMFMAGIDQQSLQEKMFLTENNIKTMFDEDSNSSVFDEDGENVKLNVTTLDADKMHLNINLGNDAEGGLMNGAGDGRIDGGEKVDGTTESKISGAGDSKINGAKDSNINGAEDSKTKSENDEANLATAWQNLDLDSCNDTASQSSTPTSPSSLKSLLTGNRRRCHKSVSFCEDVEVEMLVKKGKGKKGQAPKIRRTLSYEKIKDNSFSDSEFVLNSNNIKVNILKPRETSQNRRRNRRTPKNIVDKNSDSEAVESRIQSPRQKGKTKRQKRSNNKSGKQGSESLSERSETSEEETSGRGKAIDESTSERLDTSDDEVILKEDNKEHQQVNNNNVELKKADEVFADEDDADKPLELQDHRTASAVSFSNILIHELD